MLQLLRDKFDLLLIATMFLIVFFAFKSGELDQTTQSTMRDILIALSGSFLTALGLRPRPNQNIQTDTVKAQTVETATTQSGDINAGEIKETKKDDN